MGIYNFVLILILLGILLHAVLKNKAFDKLFFTITLLTLFIMTVGRGMGYDYESYYDIFLNCKLGHRENQDWGFAWLASVMPSYRMLLVAMTIMTFIPLYFCIQKLTPIPIFTLLLLYTTLFFPSVMGQMRQGVAVFLMLTAYLIRQRRLPCIVLVAASLLMHTAALIGLLYFVPLRKKYHIGLYVTLFIVALCIGPYLENLLGYFVQGVDIPLITYKYEFYYASETMQGYSIGLNTAILIRCFVFVLVYYMLSGTPYENHHFLNLYFLSIIVYLVFGFIPQIGGRGAVYFSVLDIFLIPQLIEVAKSNLRRLALCFVFMLLSVLRYIQFFSSDFNYTSYVPYAFTLSI